MNPLESFRKDKDEFFRLDNQSPLTPEQQQDFKGLLYFPENPSLRLEVTVEKFPSQQKISMQTSTGGIQSYLRFGAFRFQVDGQSTQLTLYTSKTGFFLPFVDALAGEETHGSGRYLEPVLLQDGKFLVDFNYAYNPYCAYNDLWSCPITPAENHLKVPIRAGEKSFSSSTDH